MNIKPFCEEDVQVLIHFINRLPSPVCLIAHNGNKFDFPILQRQLFKLNLVSGFMQKNFIVELITNFYRVSFFFRNYQILFIVQIL